MVGVDMFDAVYALFGSVITQIDADTRSDTISALNESEFGVAATNLIAAIDLSTMSVDKDVYDAVKSLAH